MGVGRKFCYIIITINLKFKMKHLKSVFFLAGTAIGSGLISLPIVLAAWGTWGAIALILCFAIVTYFSALVRCELNIQTQAVHTLKQVSLCFAGKKTALLGDVCLKLLCFTLLIAYLHGLNTLLGTDLCSKIWIVGLFFVLLLLPTNLTLGFNKLCFYGLVILIVNVMFSFIGQVNLSRVPGIMLNNFSTIGLTIPTLFTAFGFQGSLHSLTNLCENNPKLVRKACFWGCLITATIYSVWTLALTTFLFQNMPEKFGRILIKPDNIHDIMEALMHFAGFEISCICCLTIITSIIGVGISLMDDLRENLRTNLTISQKQLLCAMIIVIPTALLANTCTQAFVKILSFAGCILSIIAIFIPLFLLARAKKPFVFSELNNKWCQRLLFLFGCGVVLSECIHVLEP